MNALPPATRPGEREENASVEIDLRRAGSFRRSYGQLSSTRAMRYG